MFQFFLLELVFNLLQKFYIEVLILSICFGTSYLFLVSAKLCYLGFFQLREITTTFHAPS